MAAHAGANCRAIICEGSLAMKPKQNAKATRAKANEKLWNILKNTQNNYTKLRGNLNPKHLPKFGSKFPLRELYKQKKVCRCPACIHAPTTANWREIICEGSVAMKEKQRLRLWWDLLNNWDQGKGSNKINGIANNNLFFSRYWILLSET